MPDSHVQTNDDRIGESDQERIEESDLHRLLAAEQRRLAVDVLAGKSPPVDLEELAVALAERQHDTDDVDRATVERISTGLYHTHLPKLADVGVVEYDPESRRVEPRLPQFDALTH